MTIARQGQKTGEGDSGPEAKTDSQKVPLKIE